MKNLTKKVLAVIFAVMMVLSISPISVFALDYVDVSNSKINTDYYSFIIHSTNDYIANVIKGVDKNGNITVTQGEDAVITLDAGDYTSTYYGSMDFSATTGGSYHYGDATSTFCISTDQEFALTNSDSSIKAKVTGFGSTKYTNDSDVGGGRTTTKIATTFTISTADLAVDTYDLTLSYKYELKKKQYGSWSSKGGSYAGTVAIKLNVVSAEVEDTTTQADGASIKVGDEAGLRFRFNTSANDATEFGFIYSYANTDDLEYGEEGVRKLVATNKIYHEDTDLTTFNIVFTGIPESAYGTIVSVRSYVVDADGETHYSDISHYCFNDIAQMVLADDVSEGTKSVIRTMLNEEA